MDPACNFLRDYLPAKESKDGVLTNHVRNCPDCNDEIGARLLPLGTGS